MIPARVTIVAGKANIVVASVKEGDDVRVTLLTAGKESFVLVERSPRSNEDPSPASAVE